MYHWIVRRRIQTTFERLSVGDWKAMTNQLSSQFVYRFVGDSPLSGTRRTQISMARWWKRLFTLFPNAKFELKDIVSSGPPWRTKVMTYLTISDQIPIGENGKLEAYTNEFMQLAQIEWGKITSVLTIEDTARFNTVLDPLIASGITDAASAPIEDNSI